ncbi:LPXTG cell wall anchor domain-containing protein, partial [Enterococcus hirae]
QQVSYKGDQNYGSETSNKETTEKTFPKTGEKETNMAGVGLTMITAAGLIGLGMKKRNED